MPSRTVLDVVKWSKKDLPQESAWLLDRLRDFNLGVSVDGEFIDSETKKVINTNHLRCILRRDYLSSGRNTLEGKSLNVIIDIFLNCLKRASKEIMRDPSKQHLFHEMVYHDETL
jgi:hypothetical protein